MANIEQYQCTTEGCDQDEVLDFEQMKAHIQTVHGLDPKTTSFTKSMQMHLDGRDWYAYRYTWTQKDGAVTFSQYCQYDRKKNDPMRF